METNPHDTCITAGGDGFKGAEPEVEQGQSKETVTITKLDIRVAHNERGSTEHVQVNYDSNCIACLL